MHSKLLYVLCLEDIFMPSIQGFGNNAGSSGTFCRKISVRASDTFSLSTSSNVVPLFHGLYFGRLHYTQPILRPFSAGFSGCSTESLYCTFHSTGRCGNDAA
ncbi:hypothetical protein CHARACLAT_029103, partial [Characodon lateralis]|nr:hypothetical protein [Characodon lateralis]